MSRTSSPPLSTAAAAGQWLASLFAVASLTTANIGHAASPAPLVLEPSSPWAISVSKDACHLARSFGDGDDRVAVDFRQYGPGRVITILALGRSLRYSGKRTALVSKFGPSGIPAEDNLPRMIEQDDGRGFVETTTLLLPTPADDAAAKRRIWQPDPDDLAPTPSDRAAEGKVTELRLSGPIEREVVLQLGRMDLPMDQMRVCLDDLMERWGIDAETYHSLARLAVPSSNPGAWALTSDYPQKMLQDGMSGVVHFRLMVDKAGKPTACAVQTAGGGDFDKRTCEVMMHRARFLPALDEGGQPVPSFYVNSVRWVTG